MIFTVAIDGPAAAGKGTVARALAERFGFAHLDTGLLYRAVAARGGDPVAAARALREADLAAPGLRSAEAGQAASRVAVIPEVRAALAAFQRAAPRPLQSPPVRSVMTSHSDNSWLPSRLCMAISACGGSTRVVIS
jgi:cytidylate kinase